MVGRDRKRKWKKQGVGGGEGEKVSEKIRVEMKSGKRDNLFIEIFLSLASFLNHCETFSH